MTIHDMQNLNRATMEYISSIIIPGMSLIDPQNDNIWGDYSRTLIVLI